MPTFSQLYAFAPAVSAQGFGSHAGDANCTLTWSSVSGNPVGSLNIVRAVKANNNATSTWSITGTFNGAFGLPVSASILSIDTASMQWRCGVFTSANTSTSGPATITYSGTGVTLSGARTFAGTGAAFATATGAGATGLNWPATGTFTIAITGTLANANTTGSTVSLFQDQVAFNLNYNVPVVADSISGDEVRHSLYSDSLVASEWRGPVTSHSISMTEFLGFIQYNRPFDALATQALHTFGPIELTGAAAVTYGQSGNSTLQIEFQASQRNDQISQLSELGAFQKHSVFLDEFSSVESTDSTPIIEYSGAQAKDHLIPIEELANRRIDYNNPISLVLNLNEDSRILAEVVSRQNQDVVLPFEVLDKQVTDNYISLEELSSRRADSNSLISFTGNTSSDSNSLMEWLWSRTADSTFRLETLFGSKSDTFVTKEFWAAFRGDAIGQEEFSSVFSTDRITNKEFLFSVKPADQLALVESLFGNKADYSVILEALKRTPSDTVAPFEWLGSTLQVSDAILPIEWRALVVGVSDAILPIEFRGNFVRDWNVLDEIISINRTSDSILWSESLVSVLKDKIFPFEELARQPHSSNNPIEWSSTTGITITDSILPIEIQRLIIGDVSAKIEFIFSIAVLRDALLPLESLGIQTSHIIAPVEIIGHLSIDIISLESWLRSGIIDQSLVLEALRTQAKDSVEPVEYTSQTLLRVSDSLLPIEFQRQMFNDNIAPLESVLKTILIQDLSSAIEFRSNLASDSLFLNEIQRLLATDNILRQSWGKSVISDTFSRIDLLSRRSSDSIFKGEYTSSTIFRIGDNVLPIEFSLRAQTNATVLLEASISISIDTKGLVEFHGIPLTVLLSSFGRLSTPRGKVRISTSPGKIRLSIPIKKIRIT